MTTTRTRLAAAVALTAALTAAAPALATPALADSALADSQHARAPRIPFTAATVTEQADGSYTLTWTAPGTRHVTVYAGTDQEHIRHRTAVAHGNGGATVTVSGLGAADRWYFELVPDHGEPLTLADRSLHLASAPNFRDAGGYRTTDGQWVRMGAVYRSDDLSRLSDTDLAKLHRLGITTVYDLRTPAERQAAPDRLPAGATEISANVLGVDGTGAFNVTTPQAAVQAMTTAERTMVSAPSAEAAYRSLLGAVGDVHEGHEGHEDQRVQGAVLFHCTAGKDRTGWGAAALLTALGVPRETVEADYLASNTYRAQANAAVLAKLPAALQAVYKPLLDVRPEYLNAGFDEVQAEFGGFDGYLRTGLGLDKHRLRDLRRDLLVG